MNILYTIGHSTKPIDEFLDLLKTYNIQELVDVRTIPKSRHNPQFGIDVLPSTLKQVGIGYTHHKQLGGLRHAAKDSINTGWQNSSFRGFADYMATGEFQEALEE